MLYRIGVDIIHVERIRNAIAQNNPNYFSNLFGSEELKEAASHPQPVFFYASRFAAKEAVIKALGISPDDGIEWNQLLILKDACGGLKVVFAGYLNELAARKNIKAIDISVSYDTDYAIATALILFDQL